MCGCSNLKDSEQQARPVDYNKNIGLSGRNGKSGLTQSEIEQDCWKKLMDGKLGEGEPEELLSKCIKKANTTNWVSAGLDFLNNIFGGNQTPPPPSDNNQPPPPPAKEPPWGLIIGGSVLALGVGAYFLLRKPKAAAK